MQSVIFLVRVKLLILENIKPDLIDSSCVALGVFDGVHLGHEKVILDAVNRSKTINAISTVVTFSNHPQSIISGKNPEFITSFDKKLELLEELGVQAVLVLKFTEELAKMPAEEYLRKILIDIIHPKSISIGYNHHFGAQKKGNDVFLKELENQYNYKLSVIPPITIDNHVVSSSLIRKLIASGDAKTATKLLGRPFSIQNAVIHGEKRGRQLGFPTANLTIPKNILAPQSGVYSGFVIYENNVYKSVINVGKRPTFGDLKEDLLEVHILDFNKNIYDETIEVNFIEKIRSEKKFDSISELKDQIQKDCNLSFKSIMSFDNSLS